MAPGAFDVAPRYPRTCWFSEAGSKRLANEDSKGKSGIFYTKDPPGVVVMQQGKIVHTYKSVTELVDAHVKGVAALEREMEEVLARHCKPE